MMLRRLVSFMAVLMLLSGLAGPLLAQGGGGPHALLIKVDGVINPVKERFIRRSIEQAQEEGATLLIIQLDTPGGLLTSTRNIVEDLLESPVPVAVFVSPKGARAGSAGTFITAAANFAVMAPGSNIGAATPVSGSGEELSETLASKVENDAAALIRSIAQERGRNEDLLEATVREAASYSANEAVASNVVDFIAQDVDDLLAQLDGRSTDTGAGPKTLDTRDLAVEDIDKNPLEHFLEFISDPNVTYILLTVGGLGIVVELFNPGLIVPAVVGVICLLLAFLAIGNLPFSWAGVVFILLAVALAGFEVVVAGFGILGIGAVVCLVVGGLLLFTQFGDASPTLPPISVNRWVIAGVGAATALTLAYFVLNAVQSRRRRPPEPEVFMVGQQATVTRTLNPRGTVQTASDTWTAVSEDGRVIAVGQSVEIISIDGLVLRVAPKDQSTPYNGE